MQKASWGRKQSEETFGFKPSSQFLQYVDSCYSIWSFFNTNSSRVIVLVGHITDQQLLSQTNMCDTNIRLPHTNNSAK
jgi:hypothetical protein